MNLFISFDWDDRNQVNGFRGMLANPDIQPLNHRDKSVDEDLSAYGTSAIQQEILRKIDLSHVTVCLISQKTRNSAWVNWELEQSRLKGLPILGIILKDQPVSTMQGVPEFFSRYPRYQVHNWGQPQQLNNAIQQAYISRFR
jgi:hypothetical protein